MEFAITTATEKVHSLTKRIRALQGGTSAGKTIATLQVLIDLAQRDLTPTVTSVVSESLPHLKKGAMRDFLNIMEGHGYFEENNWNRTDSIYRFPNGSIIEFFGADQTAKVKGPRRDRLFCNEANHLPYDVFDQLMVRTKDFCILDWNPTNEFWFYTEIEGKRDDYEKIILTYLDNEALDSRIVADIEQHKHNKSWWQVYGLGQLGQLEGLIYRDWQIIDDVPHEARLERYGLDFGYTNDPSACVGIYRHNGAIILDEVFYQKGLLNRQIADLLNNQEHKAPIVADSAEPKSIDELKEYGLTMMPSVKGRDSVRHGIDLVQDQRVSVTKRSLNVIKEYRNYMWAVDKDGKPLVPPLPEHSFSHSMDAIRYGVQSLPKLVQPLTEEQKQTRVFQAAMKRKHRMGDDVRLKKKRFIR